MYSALIPVFPNSWFTSISIIVIVMSLGFTLLTYLPRPDCLRDLPLRNWHNAVVRHGPADGAGERRRLAGFPEHLLGLWIHHQRCLWHAGHEVRLWKWALWVSISKGNITRYEYLTFIQRINLVIIRYSSFVHSFFSVWSTVFPILLRYFSLTVFSSRKLYPDVVLSGSQGKCVHSIDMPPST